MTVEREDDLSEDDGQPYDIWYGVDEAAQTTGEWDKGLRWSLAALIGGSILVLDSLGVYVLRLMF